MSWRVVTISSRAKLDLQLGFMVIRGEDTKKIYINEIAVVILDSTAVSLTTALIVEMVKRKIKIIICDEKRNPFAETTCLQGSHDTSLKIKGQMRWSSEIKSLVWTEIVREKILNQAAFLKELNKQESQLLETYVTEIELGDVSNREGHAAKVYFNALFGKGFSRQSVNPINSALNYGYSLILSTFNKEIVAGGYLTQLGIFHDNMYNTFNLSCDLMEPFRPLVDRLVFSLNPEKFETEEKHKMLNLFLTQVFVDGKMQHLPNAIKIYTKSVLDSLDSNDASMLSFFSREL